MPTAGLMHISAALLRSNKRSESQISVDEIGPPERLREEPLLQRNRIHLLRRPRKLWRPLVAAVVVNVGLLATAACGGQETGPRLPEGLAEALETTSEFQRNLLQDGELTYEEYETSVLATVQCLQEHGVTISVEPRAVAGRRLEFVYESTEANDASVSSAYDSCYIKYQNLVDIAWFQQTRPTEALLATARAALAACIREAGVPLPDHPTSSDFRQLALSGEPAVPRCQQKISAEFDISEGFIG